MTIEKTLAERGSRYGKFADHAVISQGIQDVMRAAPKWPYLDQDMKQALSTIADKIARILNGDPYYADNWHDIIGYSKLIEDRINMIESEENLSNELFKLPNRNEIPKSGGLVPVPETQPFLITNIIPSEVRKIAY